MLLKIFEPDEPTIFNWKLKFDDYKTSIFEKKKMTEHTNIKMIYGFIKNNLGIAYQGIKRYDGVPFKTELDQMIKYKEFYSKKIKKFQVSFQLPKHKWGRIQPSNHTSLSVYHRPTRHSLCEGIYIDIDMVNAQPSIIVEICKHHHNHVPALKQYVENTQGMREAIMKHHGVVKDIAKNLPISLMFGGSYSGWLKEHNVVVNDNMKLKEFVEIEQEIKTIIEIVYSSNKDTIEKTVLKQDPDKWKNIEEKKRGVMAMWCQSIERLFQETSISYLVNEKGFMIEDIVPCQDGFMILKDLWYDGILNGMICSLLKNWRIDFYNIGGSLLFWKINDFIFLKNRMVLEDGMMKPWTDINYVCISVRIYTIFWSVRSILLSNLSRTKSIYY